MKRFILMLALYASASLVQAGSYEDLILTSKMGDVSSMQKLLQRGLDPDSTDRAGNTLLTIAAGEGNEALVKVLIEHKARLNLRNVNGETALQIAALKGFDGIVEALLKAGARTESIGWPALIYATYANHEGIVAQLLASGADKDATASNGMTALMFAIQMDRPGIVRQLLDVEANPDIATGSGETAYSLSLKSKNTEYIKLVEAALEKHQRKQEILEQERQREENSAAKDKETPVETEVEVTANP